MVNSSTLAGPAAPQWVKSTYSDPHGGNCVEWAPSCVRAHGMVPVRDSKVPAGPALILTPGAWATLVALARATAA
ncbi:DUF397 domain-containing protein [Streptomyces jumonjinensis]|uniref:DUF397 domain-containing protein n=1 Tax=Streptomyces jumonjinensis TaxID=1945 RepID=A0A646KL99_STRJU|nr:DUF397 domain-containing protein [Streptomyces jumonjinensis]MQT03089.1 DUF397 domain-containing protein [Streptomyces jumonjinensis]